MFDVVLTPAERARLQALNALGVPYLIVGMGAALIEGAPGTTQDLDLWFGRLDAEHLGEAARRAGGVYTAGFGVQPPALGGEGLDRIDVVLTASGLDSFDQELRGAHEYEIDGVKGAGLAARTSHRQQARGEAREGRRAIADARSRLGRSPDREHGPGEVASSASGATAHGVPGTRNL